MTHRVVDYLAQREGQVVVTATIGAGRATVDVATEPGRAPAPAELSGIQRMIKGNKITMLQLGPRTYLGLVNGRTQARPLIIGDTLFLFVPHDQPLLGLAELVADMARQLPPDMLRRSGGEWAELQGQLANLIKEAQATEIASTPSVLTR